MSLLKNLNNEQLLELEQATKEILNYKPSFSIDLVLMLWNRQCFLRFIPHPKNNNKSYKKGSYRYPIKEHKP